MSKVTLSGNIVNFVKIMEIIEQAHKAGGITPEVIDGIVKRFTILDNQSKKIPKI